MELKSTLTLLVAGMCTLTAQNVFAQAEKEVLALVQTNNWKTFTRTPQYVMCRGILLRNSIVMTAQLGGTEAIMAAMQDRNDNDIDGLNVPEREYGVEHSETLGGTKGDAIQSGIGRPSTQPTVAEEAA